MAALSVHALTYQFPSPLSLRSIRMVGRTLTNMAALSAGDMIGRTRSSSLLQDGPMRRHHTISLLTSFNTAGCTHTYAPVLTL